MMFKFSMQLCLLWALSAQAGAVDSPSGLWLAVDDLGKPTGYIRITEQNGVLRGVVERGLPTDTQEKFCTACKDQRKNQRLRGMEIISGLRRNGDVYDGGEILEPFSGKVYNATLTLLDNGAKLQVRGYLGISLFGRTQVWLREE